MLFPQPNVALEVVKKSAAEPKAALKSLFAERSTLSPLVSSFSCIFSLLVCNLKSTQLHLWRSTPRPRTSCRDYNVGTCIRDDIRDFRHSLFDSERVEDLASRFSNQSMKLRLSYAIGGGYMPGWVLTLVVKSSNASTAAYDVVVAHENLNTAFRHLEMRLKSFSNSPVSLSLVHVKGRLQFNVPQMAITPSSAPMPRTAYAPANVLFCVSHLYQHLTSWRPPSGWQVFDAWVFVTFYNIDMSLPRSQLHETVPPQEPRL